MDFKEGQVVLSLKGHDKGELLTVTGFAGVLHMFLHLDLLLIQIQFLPIVHIILLRRFLCKLRLIHMLFLFHLLLYSSL